jgi:glycosyltransferase involved in cell wall biosynthesis
MRISISAVIITKNAEKYFGMCLEALKWVDDIVVVDCGSTDDTVKTARKYGARVFIKKWAGFSAQKNFAVSKAKGKWILTLDADEIVTPGLKDELLTIVKSGTDRAGYHIPRMNYFYGKWLKHGGVYPDRHLRLFRRGKGHFPPCEIHEELKVAGETGVLKNAMIHHTKGSISAHLDSMNKYTGIESSQFLKNGYTPTGYTVFLRPFFRFISCYIFKGGFLDGIAGLVYHNVDAFNMFIREIKVLEARSFRGNLLRTLFKRAK